MADPWLFWNQPPTLEEARFFSSVFLLSTSYPFSKLRKKKGLLECTRYVHTHAFTYLYEAGYENVFRILFFFFFDQFLLECNVRLV